MGINSTANGRIRRWLIRWAAVVCALFPLAGRAGAQNFDLVILNGGVMDPETRYDGVASVGVNEGRVVGRWVALRVEPASLV